MQNSHRTLFISSLVFVVFTLSLFLVFKEEISAFNAENIQRFLEDARSSPWAFPMVCAVYILGGFVLFPVTVLSLITAAVFGSIKGPIYGIVGALISAALMFFLGRLAGLKGLRQFLGERMQKIDAYFSETGVFTVAMLRMVPIAPFTLINLAAGISRIRFYDFILGSFLGFLPAFVVRGVVGDSLVKVILHPTQRSLLYLGLGAVLWVALIVGSYFLAKRYRRKRFA